MYKVETVGDKYMVVSGVPDPLDDHARCICQLALDMKEAAEEREKMLDEDDIHVTITIGIHTGEVRLREGECVRKERMKPAVISMHYGSEQYENGTSRTTLTYKGGSE